MIESLSTAYSSANSPSSSNSFEPIKLNFLKHFHRKTGTFTRGELEELLMQKITEAIVFKTERSKYRNEQSLYETAIEKFRQRIIALEKQYKDLQLAHSDVMRKLRNCHQSGKIEPVKIVRNVGLQVISTIKSESHEPVEIPHSLDKCSEDNQRIKRVIVDRGIKRKSYDDDEKIENKKQRKSEKNQILNNMSNTNEPKANKKVAKFFPSRNENKLKSVSENQSNADHSKSPQNSSKTVENEAEDCSEISQTSPSSTTSKFDPAFNNRRTSTPIKFQNENDPPKRKLPDLPETSQKVHSCSHKKIPPTPKIKVEKISKEVKVTWDMNYVQSDHNDIKNYQLYAYNEADEAKTDNWACIDNIEHNLLPITVTISGACEDVKYYFAVRAVDCENLVGKFSKPKSWK